MFGAELNDSSQAILEVKKLAEEILEVNGATDADVVARARILQNHFLLSDRYKYTLDFSTVPRDPDAEDPIVDFLTNHRSGHCEYFASALTMMLRSQGIPARMVVGYKVERYNEVGEYYQVYQSDAHAWVEAYLETNEIPEYALDSPNMMTNGAWLRLDPTPAADYTGEETCGGQFDGSRRRITRLCPIFVGSLCPRVQSSPTAARCLWATLRSTAFGRQPVRR